MGPDVKAQRDYQAEDDFRTLERAGEVTGDKKRHAAAKSHGQKRLTTIGKIVGAGKTLGKRR